MYNLYSACICNKRSNNVKDNQKIQAFASDSSVIKIILVLVYCKVLHAACHEDSERE
jgi:hypothetical protein